MEPPPQSLSASLGGFERGPHLSAEPTIGPSLGGILRLDIGREPDMKGSAALPLERLSREQQREVLEQLQRALAPARETMNNFLRPQKGGQTATDIVQPVAPPASSMLDGELFAGVNARRKLVRYDFVLGLEDTMERLQEQGLLEDLMCDPRTYFM